MQQNSRKRPLLPPSARDIENSNATARAMLGNSISHHSWMQPGGASVSASTLSARKVRPPRQRPSVPHVETSPRPPVAPTAPAPSDQTTEGASPGPPVPTRRPTVTMLPTSPYGFLPSPAPSEDNPNPHSNPSKSPHQPSITQPAPVPASATSSPNLQSMSMPNNPAPNYASPLAANFAPNTVPFEAPVLNSRRPPAPSTAALASPVGQQPLRVSVWYIFTPPACLPHLSSFMTSNVSAMEEPDLERLGLLHDAINQNDWPFMMLSNILSLYVVDEKSLAPYSPPFSRQALTLANSLLLYNGARLSHKCAEFLATFPASLANIRASLGDEIFYRAMHEINVCFQHLTANLETVIQTCLRQKTLPLLRDLIHFLKIRSRVFQRAVFRYVLFRTWDTDTGEYVESALREFLNEQQQQHHEKSGTDSQSQYTVYKNLYNQHRQSLPTVNSPSFISSSMNSPSTSLSSNNPTPQSHSQLTGLTVAQRQAQLQARHIREQQARQQVAAALQFQRQTQLAQSQSPIQSQSTSPQPQQQAQQRQYQYPPHFEQPHHQNPIHQQSQPQLQHQNPHQFQQMQHQTPLHFQQPQIRNLLHQQPQYQNPLRLQPQPRALPSEDELAMMNQNIMSNLSSRMFNQNVALNQPTTPNAIQLQQQRQRQRQRQRTMFFPAKGDNPANIPAIPTPQKSALHHAHLRSPILRPRARDVSSRVFRRPAGFALPPVKLTTNPIQNFHFTLSDDQLQQILKLEPGIHGFPPFGTFDDSTITCRLRCCRIGEDSDLPQENQWALLDGYWPALTYFSLNGEILEPRKKLHYGKYLPIDLTKFLKSSNELTVNVLRTSTDNSCFDYAIAVDIIRFSEHETIKQECLNTRLIPCKDVLESIKSSLACGEDDELAIVQSNLTIHLFEPFSNAKIFDIPARGRDCRHREAFDLDTFLETRESIDGVSKPDVWRCPVCRLDCRPESILVDGFLMDVRKELAAKNMLKTRAITIESDGSWTAKPEAQDSDDDDDEEQETRNEVTRRRRVSVISLDD